MVSCWCGGAAHTYVCHGRAIRCGVNTQYPRTGRQAARDTRGKTWPSSRCLRHASRPARRGEQLRTTSWPGVGYTLGRTQHVVVPSGATKAAVVSEDKLELCIGIKRRRKAACDRGFHCAGSHPSHALPRNGGHVDATPVHVLLMSALLRADFFIRFRVLRCAPTSRTHQTQRTATGAHRPRGSAAATLRSARTQKLTSLVKTYGVRLRLGRVIWEMSRITSSVLALVLPTNDRLFAFLVPPLPPPWLAARLECVPVYDLVS